MERVLANPTWAKRERIVISFLLLTFLIVSNVLAEDASFYVKKDTWQETVLASREALMKEEKAQGGGVTLDFAQEEFTIAAWVKTKAGGPIFVKSAAPGVWEVASKILTIQQDEGNLLYLVSIPRERREDDSERHTDEDSFGGLAIALGQLEGQGLDIRDGQWHHVAMSGANLRYNFYVDGKPIESLTLWNFRKAGPDNPQHNIYAGWPEFEAFGERQPGFKGELDEFQIFSKKLSPEEVAGIYRDPGSVKAGLAGCGRF